MSVKLLTLGKTLWDVVVRWSGQMQFRVSGYGLLHQPTCNKPIPDETNAGIIGVAQNMPVNKTQLLQQT